MPAPSAAAALAALAALTRTLLSSYILMGSRLAPHRLAFPLAFALTETVAAGLALYWIPRLAAGPPRVRLALVAGDSTSWTHVLVPGVLLASALALGHAANQIAPGSVVLAVNVLVVAIVSSAILPATRAASRRSPGGLSARGVPPRLVPILALVTVGVLILLLVYSPLVSLAACATLAAYMLLTCAFAALPSARLADVKTLAVASICLAVAAVPAGVLSILFSASSTPYPIPAPLGNTSVFALTAGVLILSLALTLASSTASGSGLASGESAAFLLASLAGLAVWTRGIPADALDVSPVWSSLAFALIYAPGGFLAYLHYRASSKAGMAAAGAPAVKYATVFEHETDTPAVSRAAMSDDDDDDPAAVTLGSPIGHPRSPAVAPAAAASSPTSTASFTMLLAALLGFLLATTLAQLLLSPTIPGADPCASLLFARRHPQPSPGTAVLVTGGSGFIGSNLVELLLDLGYKVRVLDNLSTGYFHNIAHLIHHPRFEFHLGDILNLDHVTRAVDGVKYVYHLAAMSKVAPSMKDPTMAKYCLETNSLGTINVLNASRALDVKKVVYAASSTYYGNGKTPMREDAAPDLLTPYSSSKYEGEIQMDIYDRIFGLPTVSIRFMMVYGPRQPTTGAYAIVTGVFVKKLAENASLPIEGDGSHFRDFIHVKDIGESLILAQQHPTLRNAVINSGTGQGHSVQEVADLVSSRQEHVAPRRNDLVGTLADTCKAKRVLGFEAKYDFVTEMGAIIDDAKDPKRVTARPHFGELVTNLTATPWLLPPMSLEYLYRPWTKNLEKAAAAAVRQPDFIKDSWDETNAKSLVVIPYAKHLRALAEHSLYTAVAHGHVPHVLLVAENTDAAKDCLTLNAACFNAEGSPLPNVVARLLDLGYTVYVTRPGTAIVRDVWKSFGGLLADTGADVLVPDGFKPSVAVVQFVATPKASKVFKAVADADEEDMEDMEIDKAFGSRVQYCATRDECSAAIGNDKVAVVKFKTAYECLQPGKVPFASLCKASGDMQHVVYFDAACVKTDEEVELKMKQAKAWWMAQGTCPETAEVCIGVPKRMLKLPEPGTEDGGMECVGGVAKMIAKV